MRSTPASAVCCIHPRLGRASLIVLDMNTVHQAHARCLAKSDTTDLQCSFTFNLWHFQVQLAQICPFWHAMSFALLVDDNAGAGTMEQCIWRPKAQQTQYLRPMQGETSQYAHEPVLCHIPLPTTSPVPRFPLGPCSFVTRTGSQLLLDGQPFTYVGANSYYLLTMAAGVSTRPLVSEAARPH